MSSGDRPRGESAARPAFGMSRPAFGLTKDARHRVEILFAFKGGGTLGAFHDLGAEMSEQSFGEFVQQLREQVARGHGVVTFADAWRATGQHAWIDVSEVSGFTARPAR